MDLSIAYSTKLPESLLKVNQDIPEADFQKFKKFHLNLKKKLELDLIKRNRRHEIINNILKLTEPGNNREDQRSRFEYT